VCIGVLVLRKRMADAPRAFRVPLVPLIPILGVVTCFFMMAFLPFDTWIRLIVWMIIGLDVYLKYGMKHSILSSGNYDRKSYRTVGFSGLIMSLALLVLAILHHY